jgi:RHS repeat-associated protein
VSEEHRFHNPTATGTAASTKTYDYDAYGARIGMTNQRSDGQSSEYTYGYDIQGSVSLLLDGSGTATAQYGYTPYGQPDPDLTEERDHTNTVIAPDDLDPLNPYRYQAKHVDSGSGTLDMGARRYTPDTGRFLQQDYYTDALGNLDLGTDPLTSNRYSLAGANPVSYIETDGHEPATSYNRNAKQIISGVREADAYENVRYAPRSGPDQFYSRTPTVKRPTAGSIPRRNSPRYCPGTTATRNRLGRRADGRARFRSA